MSPKGSFRCTAPYHPLPPCFCYDYARQHQNASRRCGDPGIVFKAEKTIIIGKKATAKSRKPPAYYAELYRANGLTGGHIIKLGPNNDKAAKEAIAAWQGGVQVGGGINEDNAGEWLSAGASKVRRRFC